MLHALDYSAVPYMPAPLWEKSKSLTELQKRLTCLANQYQSFSKKEVKFMGNNMRVEVCQI